ncbi:hypothetical protein CICLE_v10006397mg [Citrus x clementina]|uniref:Uncharacterized protein n=2 Tax=Citrus TaxID=2706 RepID=V4S549_CITCL|nr:hypothetical protein CICLE_v10006397mg [Citrus x clementina]GAY48605.1 hypothetical protein CUMW_112980 [Citrus unshiu]
MIHRVMTTPCSLSSFQFSEKTPKREKIPHQEMPSRSMTLYKQK